MGSGNFFFLRIEILGKGNVIIWLKIDLCSYFIFDSKIIFIPFQRQFNYSIGSCGIFMSLEFLWYGVTSVCNLGFNTDSMLFF